MKELVGKIVKRILINASDEIIAFDTDEGIIAYETDGDCCSSTWIESMTGVEALIGQEVLTQASMDMPTPESRDYKNGHYVEELQDYGEKLTTKNGYFDLVYRNSSNGYYGGSLYLRKVSNLEGFKEVTDDWVAA